MGAAVLTLLRAAPGPAVARHPALCGAALWLSQCMHAHCWCWRSTQPLGLAVGAAVLT